MNDYKGETMDILILTLMIVGIVLFFSYKDVHGELKVPIRIRRWLALIFLIALMLNVAISIFKMIRM